MKCEHLKCTENRVGLFKKEYEFNCELDPMIRITENRVNNICTNDPTMCVKVYKKNNPNAEECYLTTITCEMLGLPDDNKYLETMRWYRDNVMMKLDNGVEIWKDYNNVGPQIAEYIRRDKNNFEIASFCCENYIQPTVDLINQGKELAEKGESIASEKAYYMAMKPYMEMTLGLMEYFKIDKNELEANVVYDKGIARIKKQIDNKKDSE